MGNILLEYFDKEFKNDIESRTEYNIGYPTGLPTLDFLCGEELYGIDQSGNRIDYINIGITDGTINTVIGRSGCGKSTFLAQIAANIVRPFPNSVLYYDDCEANGISLPRLQDIARFTRDETINKIKYRNTGINIESVFRRIKAIYNFKMENKDKLSYNTGKFDIFGNPIYKLEPTVYVIDSIPSLLSKSIEDESELSGQMAAAKIAKDITAILKRFLQPLKGGNIILFLVNHINDDININPYAPKQAQIAGLQQGETMPAGKAVVYYTSGLIRLSDKGRLTSDKELGINGSNVQCKLIKSRSSDTTDSTPVNLIYAPSYGFDADLSLYSYLKTNGRIKGAGAYFYLDTLPDVKFAQKNFKTKIREDEEFRKVLTQIASEELKKLIISKKYDTMEESFCDSLYSHLI